jgi:hypothetical protein
MTTAKFRTPREQLLAQKPKLVDTSKINHDQLINAVKEVFLINL